MKNKIKDLEREMLRKYKHLNNIKILPGVTSANGLKGILLKGNDKSAGAEEHFRAY